MTYEVTAKTNRREICWETDSRVTANKWFDRMIRTKRTIDTDDPVLSCKLQRGATLLRSATLG